MSLHIALDLPSSSLSEFGVKGKGIVWPTPYAAYLSASNDITDQLLNALNDAGLSDIAKASAVSVLGRIIIDAERTAKVSLDLTYAHRMDAICHFDKNHSPVTAYLAMSDAAVETSDLSILDFYPDRSKNNDLKGSLLNIARMAKTTWEMYSSPVDHRLDIHNDSPLMAEFLREGTRNTILLRPEAWRLSRNTKIALKLSDLAHFAGQVVKQVLQDHGCAAQLCARASKVTQSFALERLAAAYRKAHALSAMRLEKSTGAILIGGTPKDIGRLLNWRYQQMGKKVWRFSHGGDRAFFIDPIWSVTELPYVDVYHLHGAGEEDRLQSRYDDKRLFVPPGRSMKFASYGSRKHQRLWKRGKKLGGRRRQKEALRVVLVTGSFLGEQVMGSLTFKEPDPLIADTQSHLIEVLVRHGFEVQIKAHPKGLFSNLLLHERFEVPYLKVPFDPVDIEADCFLFEFAGSAFFDALASEKGVVLIDMGNRPWDKSSRSDLEARCEIVKAQPDEFNRIRVDESAFVEAVKRACSISECPDSFAGAYFFGSSSQLN